MDLESAGHALQFRVGYDKLSRLIVPVEAIESSGLECQAVIISIKYTYISISKQAPVKEISYLALPCIGCTRKINGRYRPLE